MKYINKKLPLVTVDKEIDFRECVETGIHCFDNGSRGNGALHCSKDDLQRLISEGWIEEVKPREFEITFADGNYITRVRELNAQNEIINPNFYVDFRKNTTIKVREVL